MSGGVEVLSFGLGLLVLRVLFKVLGFQVVRLLLC